MLGRNLKGGSDTGRLISEALATIRNKVTRVGTTLTVYDQDNVTVLYTATIVTSAGQLPVSSVTP